MKKDLLDELMEALQKLKGEQKTITVSVPVAPGKVLGVIREVAKNHELTQEEKKALAAAAAAMDGDVTAADMEALSDLF